jgi:ADP-heptose:LPS heptosyltransferase
VAEVRRILVVKFWGIGNWALLRPVIRDLRAHRPVATLDIVTLEGNAPLARDLCDRLHLVRPTGVGRVIGDLVRAVRALRRDPPDLSLDFEPFSRAGALLARAARARQRIGFRSGAAGRDGLHTVLVPFREDAHAARSFRALAEVAGVPPGPYEPGALAPTPGGLAEAAPFAGPGPFVVLHPGSGDNFPGRRWSAAGFAAVGRTAARMGRRVVVTGSESEAALASRVAASVGERARTAAGRLSLEGLVGLLAGAEALVANDTGPVHLASALGRPVLALYGPNTPRLYGPLSPGSRPFYRGLPCSPCLLAANYRSSRCRIFTCMESIPAGEVATALARLLETATCRAAPSS